ncbi:hypothetical protein NQ318_020192 [Aromia moschata]|uniref:ZAD domain-containing protein n=1 Tax=Aromia moschata TaxID=1265417 RepID=A0AAV8ZAT8_9CUCU|nr:hypothetical protein NQ318_020192 [Aromia moschata]
MYYLSKFCRICVQTGVKLLDLDTLDFDEVKLSEKLEVCTKMVVNRESLSTEICVQCITKLRISYQFHDMCKKSTKTLQGYLQALLCGSENEKSGPHQFRATRCSLLKRLLTPTDKFKKERDKYPYKHNYYFNSYKGGLKNIIRFTKNYEFGVKLDKNSNYESTPLDKLTAFSNEFFRKDFTEFRNTILYIIENKDNLYDSGDSEDEGLFLRSRRKGRLRRKRVEPDIKIKTELEYEDEEFTYTDEEPHEVECKREIEEHNIEEPSLSHHCVSLPTPAPASYSEYMRSFGHLAPAHSPVQLLDNLVGGYHPSQRRTFSQTNVRCRTRDNPYINPLLKNQFLYRCFKCEKCNRYFKSPGYLKAHYSKVH